MEIKEIEVFSEQTNLAIVRMPGRHFPGCVIQGDSLSVLLSCAERACELASKTNEPELIDEIEDLKKQLEYRIRDYEKVIKAHGFQVPYDPPRDV